jgi:23S rRNA pseudouridine1911/1915/1917 synthase
VHPAAGNYRGTLVAGLLARSSLGGGDPFRPGIVHRLDKDTSGLLVVAKSVAAHEGLSAQFRKHTARRRYRALVRGVPATEGTIRTPYGRNPRDRLRFTGRRPAGRQAVTHYRVVEPFARLASMVLCELETGRTHQVRVHMSEIGHPLLCDALYGGTSCDRRIAPVLRALGRQALHAEHLAFDHPVTGERIELEAKLPEDMRQAVLLLRSLG